MAATVVGTTASVFPAFLTGAVGVQLRNSIGIDDAGLGLAIGAFFMGAALGSALLGGVAERMGGPRAMRAGLMITVTAGALIAALARSSSAFFVLLFLAGAANALTQPAANLMLSESLGSKRLGFAFAIKQSGMPSATLLGGLAVPALALTLGWQSAYGAGVLLAFGALAMIPNAPSASATRARGARRNRPDLPLRLMVLYAMVGGFGAASAGALVGFLVSAAESADFSPASAGLLLTGGSIIGIGSRILQGRLADSGRVLPIRQAALLFALGGLGMLILALDRTGTYLIGIVPAFGFGWAWPGLFNLSVVRNNPSAPAAATGISQTGVYIGAGAGPAVGGFIVEFAGYPGLWLAGATASFAAAALAMMLRILVRRERMSRLPLPT